MNSVENDIYSFSDKWSPEIGQYNFTQVPNLLLSCQGHLGISDGELLTLIHLLTFWFNHNSRIYPSISTLTKFSHKGYSTVQKRLRILEEKGFVKRRHMNGTSNTYDLIPCISSLYDHQRYCVNPPRKQGDYRANMKPRPQQFLKSKEYQALIKPFSNNTENLISNYGNHVTIA